MTPPSTSPAIYSGADVCSTLCSFSSRANRQDFELRNLRIIEPHEVTSSGDRSVETGNSNSYTLGIVSG